MKRYPTFQTYLGKKTDYDRLNNYTEAYALESRELTKKHLKQLKGFKYDALDEQSKLSYRIYKQNLENDLNSWRWRYHGYPINQMFGYHSSMPSFFINYQSMSNTKEAKAYISRLKEIKRVFAERLVDLKEREKRNILPPAFVFSKVQDDIKNIISGYPFTQGKKQNSLYIDFKKKVDALKISQTEKKALKEEAKSALLDYVGPAYSELASYLKGLARKATNSHGVWALPNGQEYYNHRLKMITTTDMTATEIHELGLKEVARIHKEMDAIRQKVGFKGDLKQFFVHLRNDKKLFLPNNSKGRKRYLASVDTVIADMKKSLPKMFKTLPKADLVVKPVETYREKSAGIAFYNGPSIEGNRPGIYYVNLYDMNDHPSYKMEALAYHEALPGHHMQIAISRELEDLPMFRRTGGYTAYSEGWGLYSEYLPKEFGFYKDPYSDFGRLTMELWRACRLVTDTGIHLKKWDREKAINYLTENTPNSHLEISKGIERYFVMPGQATAYKIGMNKILDLRAIAKASLGSKFDIRDFHDVILTNGPLPLSILEEQVQAYIQNSQAKTL